MWLKSWRLEIGDWAKRPRVVKQVPVGVEGYLLESDKKPLERPFLQKSRFSTSLGVRNGVNERNESYGLLSDAQRKAVASSLLDDDDDDDDFIEKGNEDGGCENTKRACEFVFSPLVHFLQFYMC